MRSLHWLLVYIFLFGFFQHFFGKMFRLETLLGRGRGEAKNVFELSLIEIVSLLFLGLYETHLLIYELVDKRKNVFTSCANTFSKTEAAVFFPMKTHNFTTLFLLTQCTLTFSLRNQ